MSSITSQFNAGATSQIHDICTTFYVYNSPVIFQVACMHERFIINVLQPTDQRNMKT